MSLADIVRPHGRHRAVDEVARLRQQIHLLLLLICWLVVQLAQATAKASRCSVAEEQAAEATRRTRELKAEVTALNAALANALVVSDRPARAAVTETQPIPIVASTGTVWPLGEAAARGLL